jgi:predicted nucleotidyltransferase
LPGFFNGRETVGEVLERRRKETAERISKLRLELKDAEAHCSKTACVYMTGSFSRGEANRYSDLDLFIVGKAAGGKRTLGGLNEILIEADLIRATRKLGIPDFSGEGEYLTHYTVEDIVGTLGKPEDDVSNTFTARLLLLLESRPLIGEGVYHEVIPKVVQAYCKDYADHTTEFVPGFLANDILRMWRTFCVNYEARTQNAPPAKKAKRRLKNYKLKHSRLLTCYSALLYLLVLHLRNRTVSPENIFSMVALTPTERIEWLTRQSEVAQARSKLEELLGLYEEFLVRTDASEDELVERIMDKTKSKEYFESYRFGDLVFEVLQTVGAGNHFYRLLVV